MARKHDPDRLLRTAPFRHYRRRYSGTEMVWGLLSGMVLVVLISWVVWRKDNPADPQLFGLPTSSKEEPKSKEDGQSILSPEIVTTGWSLDAPVHFGSDNLYEKINGREGYFKSFGFKKLSFFSLRNEKDDTKRVDIELYDLGAPENAAGAFLAEDKKGDIKTHPGGLGFRSRNAVFWAGGNYYMRAIGADESNAVMKQLDRIYEASSTLLPQGVVPPVLKALAAELELPMGALRYFRENAFSFAFGKAVFVAQLEKGQQVFVVPRESEESAKALASDYVSGFASLGDVDETTGWVIDPFLQTFSFARAYKRWVLGVRGVEKIESGKAALARLERVANELE